MPIDHISPGGDVEAITKMNLAIDEANKIPAVEAATTQVAKDLVGAIATLRVEANSILRSANDTTRAGDAALRADIDKAAEVTFGLEPERPGDAPAAFSEQVSGRPTARLPLDPSRVVIGSDGRVVEVVGEHAISPRAAYRIEPGRRYLARYVYRRQVNPTDPAGDVVACAINWLNRFQATTGSLAIVHTGVLTVAAGRQSIEVVVASAAGSGIDVVAPAGAVYCSPYLQTFGLDGVTHAEMIGWSDITDLGGYSPDLSSLTGRVGALESIDTDNRLTVIEGQIAGTSTRFFPTITLASGATIGVSVDYLNVAGQIHARIGADPGHGRAFQSADGSWWALATPTLDTRAPALTLTPGVADPAADVVGATTVHVTGNECDTVGLYDGSQWLAHAFSDFALALLAGTYGANTVYDVYAFLESGLVKFGTKVWASPISRGTGAGTTELEVFQGRRVNKFAITLHENGKNHAVPARRALLCGSFRTRAAGQAEDSASFRLVDRVTNPRRRTLKRIASTSNWTYSANAWALANNGDGNLVIGYLHCLAGRPVEAEVMDGAVNSTATVRVVRCDVGLGSAVPNAQISAPAVLTGYNSGFCHARYRGYPGIGYRELWWLERGSGADAQTWNGTGGASTSGITAEV